MAGRSPSETRRAVLDAAGDAIRSRGLDVSLQDIAHAAGLTRGGLLYHFASRQKLFLALVADVEEQLRVLIDRKLDPEDDKPGRLTRAYVRALLTPATDEAIGPGSAILLTQLLVVPAVRELTRVHTERLEEELLDDGLPEDLVRFVVATADGAYSPPLWGGKLNPDVLARIEARLLSLTLNPTSWSTAAWTGQTSTDDNAPDPGDVQL